MNRSARVLTAVAATLVCAVGFSPSAHAEVPSSAPGDAQEAAETLADSTDMLERVSARLSGTRKQLRVTNKNLEAAQRQLVRSKRELRRAQKAEEAAQLEAASALLVEADASYRAAGTREVLSQFAKDLAAEGAAATPLGSYSWLMSPQDDALADAAITNRAAGRVADDQAQLLSEFAVETEAAEVASIAAESAADRAAAFADEAKARARQVKTLIASIAEDRARLERLASKQRKVVKKARAVVARDRAAAAQFSSFAPTGAKTLDNVSPSVLKSLMKKTSRWVLPATGSITSAYGMRFHPVLKYNKVHTGTDFSAGDGFIYSPAAGVVVSAGYNTAYGNIMVVSHGSVDGHEVQTWHAHQSSFQVAVGDTVKRGQVLGRIGSTGYSTGPHLHFEIRVGGQHVDPMAMLTGAPLPR